MITIIFNFANEKILISINGNQVYFSSTAFGAQKSPIEGLKLDYSGVCREFPDLEIEDNWNGIAIKRFKEKLKSFKTEKQIADYLIEDLRKFGYVPESIQEGGFRPRRIK